MTYLKHSIKLLCLCPLFAFAAQPSELTQLETAAAQLSLGAKCDALTQADSNAANKLFQQSKFKTALQKSIPLAQCGDLRAKLEVGFMYEFGQGTKQNYNRAALWYFTGIRLNAYNQKPLKRAIDAYFGLNGSHKNIKSAARWFRMAAELSTDRY